MTKEEFDKFADDFLRQKAVEEEEDGPFHSSTEVWLRAGSVLLLGLLVAAMVGYFYHLCSLIQIFPG